jgi:hypothetical protein
MDDILITSTLSIRECGHDESWLRDRIYEDPSILGLGDLQPVMKERSQAQGGRLDLLLKNPDDDSMFEVELQLGPTDESHIIRTIEYWDNEKKKWPRRSHTAVLVAEDITSRFFNVVQLLSLAVPIKGIKVNVVQIGETYGLHFDKIIDSYEEPEEDEPSQMVYDEKHWISNYPKTLECIRWYRDLLSKYYGEIPIKYFESYISLSIGGKARAWISKRKNDRSFFEVKYVGDDIDQVVDHLNKEGFSFGLKDNEIFTFNVNLQQLKEKQTTHEWIISKIAPQYLTGAAK